MHKYKQTQPPLRYAGDGVIDLLPPPGSKTIALSEKEQRKKTQHLASITTQRFQSIEHAGKAVDKFRRKWGPNPAFWITTNPDNAGIYITSCEPAAQKETPLAAQPQPATNSTK